MQSFLVQGDILNIRSFLHKGCDAMKPIMKGLDRENNHSAISLDLVDIASRPEWKQMLVDIVTKEKMDPWDIDISHLAASFLEKIREMRKLDFRIPANAVLASSILLRFKSDAWVLREIDTDHFVFIPDQLITEPVIPDLQPHSRITKRKMNLEELISAIEDIMKKEKIRARRTKPERIIPPTLVEIVGETDENFEEKIEEIYEKIKKSMDKENLVIFSDLLDKKTVEEMINYFVPLLHLANKQRILMWQEQIFGDIYIYVPDGKGKNRSNRKPKIKRPRAKKINMKSKKKKVKK